MNKSKKHEKTNLVSELISVLHEHVLLFYKNQITLFLFLVKIKSLTHGLFSDWLGGFLVERHQTLVFG